MSIQPIYHAEYTIQGVCSARSSSTPVDIAVPDSDTADHDLVRYEAFHLVVLAIDDALDLDASDDPLVVLVVVTTAALAFPHFLYVLIRCRLFDVPGVVLSDRSDVEPDPEKVVDVSKPLYAIMPKV